MAITNLIHKTNVYFDVVDPELHQEPPAGSSTDRMHHGEIYIYLNQIYLNDGQRWYKANIRDIKKITSSASEKLIQIHFWDYDLVLYCEEYTHLLALRDFLFLSQNNPIQENLMLPEGEVVGGGDDF